MMARLRDTRAMTAARDWIHRHVVGLAIFGSVCLAGALLLGALGLIVARDEANHRAATEHAQAVHDRAIGRRDKWDRQSADHAACVRQADGRVKSRLSFFDIFDLIAGASPQDSPRHADVLVFVVEAKAKVLARLPDIDCAKVAPPPKGPRPIVP